MEDGKTYESRWAEGPGEKQMVRGEKNQAGRTESSKIDVSKAEGDSKGRRAKGSERVMLREVSYRCEMGAIPPGLMLGWGRTAEKAVGARGM